MPRRLSLGLQHALFLDTRKQKLPPGEELLGYTSENADETVLLCPDVGTISEVAPLGSYLEEGDDVARLHQLGQSTLLRVPEGVFGYVVASSLEGPKARQSQLAAQYNTAIVILNHQIGARSQHEESRAGEMQSQAGSILPSPSSGRFYRRPAPDKDPFIEVGQIIEVGKTVGLLEIMKTFARVQFQGPKIPKKAKIVEVLAEDDDELATGDAILRFEAVDG